ncbi:MULTISPECIES: ABC transporter permease [Methylobacterium]|jgi:peptide/nickel transport system permease protein|uniref:ABC transporter permease n=1 Tax=Methylobacterium brachiatum TaxID=269660 RepID=A0AAJ1WWU0_9HYPH|nr:MULTISPECIES: ABC transporter permease [Methylobacterium]EIZ82456.1 binding-protein-dependent transport system inner membrane protein [Methylobacterium sp. GXF4]MCB4803374.1 ABC transporter permease [Methylobacterium brachiatum]MDH2312596.1 ABC transporter permease [Methylobacterium brachiatum]MDQ0544105.1 peptide/nickel transport system permease protein [Methylobacterium brachiatum]CAA2156706.1 Dipeptide transport system permease protein DppC [Methylobacterium brachiatum]
MSGRDIDAGGAPPVPLQAATPGRLARWRDSDLLASFLRSKTAIVALLATILMVGLAVAAPLISPQNPYDPAQLDLINSNLPPIWQADGQAPFYLGTDDQGRDVLSAVLYGLRLSLIVGVLGVITSGIIGIALGLIAGYAGGALDTLIMRVADVQLTFPAILIALVVDGVARASFGGALDVGPLIGLIVISIGLSFWVQYARTVRSSVMVEKGKDYVQAARLIGLTPPVILVRHVLPNVTGPVFVIATINLALAIITEATLSFLGTGLPETMPSLGTLIRTGNRFLFSGEWWIVAFPGLALAGLVIAINLLGDWLRDALNPKLQ